MEGFGVLALVCLGLGGLLLLVMMLRPLDRVLTDLTRLVYSQGDSSEAFLLKVIISILFPPIFFYLIWVVAKDFFSPPISDAMAEERAALKLEKVKTDARKMENSRLWSGQHNRAVIVRDETVLDETAVKSLQYAAEAGDGNARLTLGFAHAAGKSVPQDYTLSLMWFYLAAAAGHDDAAGNLESLVKDMTTEDVSKAQQMASDWMKVHP